MPTPEMICDRCPAEPAAGPLACQTCEKERKSDMLEFTLPVAPTAQARPRVAVRGKFAHAYKTRRQEANERTLEAWLKEHAPPEPMPGPLVLEFIAALPVPASVSRRARADMLAGCQAPTKKPDLDNLAKQLKDAMTRLQFWRDDKQVVCLRCEKIYAETGCWKVAVYPARGGS
jgi:Holliday junction resolvase RusA-like endonuclease